MAKAKRYRTLFIEPGLVDYDEEGQRTTVLVRRPALDKMRSSFLGKPVFNLTHKDVDPDVAFNGSDAGDEEKADGVISNVGYDAESGYDFADMMIWDEETQKNLDDGFLVSCAYKPTEVSPGGSHNSVPYDEEVLDGEYDHMAIVDNPRYEGVRVFANSKSGGNMKRKLVFGKKRENADPPEEKKEDEATIENTDGAYVEIDGEKVPVDELVNAYTASKKNAEEDDLALNMEDTVDIDGEDVSVKDLVENYQSGMEKENAEDATDDQLEPATKENSADPKVEKPKKNENFKKIQNAADRGASIEKPNVRTQNKRLSDGKSRYGSPVKNGGAE